MFIQVYWKFIALCFHEIFYHKLEILSLNGKKKRFLPLRTPIEQAKKRNYLDSLQS